MSFDLTGVMWAEATRDRDAELDAEQLIRGKLAVARFWPFLAAAGSDADFGHRHALIQDDLVARVPPQAVQPVLSSLYKDWKLLHAARQEQALQQHLAALQRTATEAAERVPAPGQQYYHGRLGGWVTVGSRQEAQLQTAVTRVSYIDPTDADRYSHYPDMNPLVDNGELQGPDGFVTGGEGEDRSQVGYARQLTPGQWVVTPGTEWPVVPNAGDPAQVPRTAAYDDYREEHSTSDDFNGSDKPYWRCNACGENNYSYGDRCNGCGERGHKQSQASRTAANNASTHTWRDDHCLKCGCDKPERGEWVPKCDTVQEAFGDKAQAPRTAAFTGDHVTHYVNWAKNAGHNPDEVSTLKRYEQEAGVGRAHTNFLADQLYIGGGDSDWRKAAHLIRRQVSHQAAGTPTHWIERGESGKELRRISHEDLGRLLSDPRNGWSPQMDRDGKTIHARDPQDGYHRFEAYPRGTRAQAQLRQPGPNHWSGQGENKVFASVGASFGIQVLPGESIEQYGMRVRALLVKKYAGEGIVPTPGPNPNYFSQGSEGLAGPPSFPVDPAGGIEPKTDNRMDDLYGGVPPQVSGGSQEGQVDGAGYSRNIDGQPQMGTSASHRMIAGHPAEDLVPGDSYEGPKGVRVHVLGEQEPHEDIFGRKQFKYRARRADTGVEGYVTFGPGGTVEGHSRGTTASRLPFGQHRATEETRCGECGVRLTQGSGWAWNDEHGKSNVGTFGSEGYHNHHPAEHRPPVSNPAVHTFDSTGEAYDRSQTEDHIKDGDVLSVPKEGVHGYLYKAWPIAVAHPGNPGAFHTFKGEGHEPRSYEDQGRYGASVAKAQEVAAQHGHGRQAVRSAYAHRQAATDGRIVGHCDHCRNPVRYHTGEDGVDELRHLHNGANRCSDGKKATASLRAQANDGTVQCPNCDGWGVVNKINNPQACGLCKGAQRIPSGQAQDWKKTHRSSSQQTRAAFFDPNDPSVIVVTAEVTPGAGPMDSGEQVTDTNTPVPDPAMNAIGTRRMADYSGQDTSRAWWNVGVTDAHDDNARHEMIKREFGDRAHTDYAKGWTDVGVQPGWKNPPHLRGSTGSTGSWLETALRAQADTTRARPTWDNPTGAGDDFTANTWENAIQQRPMQRREDRGVNTPTTPQAPVPTISSSDPRANDLDEDRTNNQGADSREASLSIEQLMGIS